MKDEEIEKALEIHYRRGGLHDCETCPYYNEFCHGDCLRAFGKDMQDYINRLKAEIEKLKAVDNRVAFCNAYDHLQADYKRVVKEKKQLKAENAGLTGALEATKTDNENLTRTLEECNEELENIRKETAKEILQPLYEKADIGTHDENNDFAYVCLQFKSRILAKAKEYGVEVEE